MRRPAQFALMLAPHAIGLLFRGRDPVAASRSDANRQSMRRSPICDCPALRGWSSSVSMQHHSRSLWIIFGILLVDTMGFGIVIPILPKLVEQMLGGAVAEA